MYAATIRPVAAGVAVTVAVTLVTAAGAVGAVVWLERHLAIARPTSITHISRLSPRENEVLAAIAAGATNAGVAADLFLSERTVEQHVRSIFSKLGLVDRDSSNHRVRAAVIWWQHQEHEDAVGAEGWERRRRDLNPRNP
ncbi:MAG: helix-turn-helix transcriptional regulator [Micrococcales bacterium]|nr:helix-turn-helix transcriptional regulator [Micrococcales bacterium]